VPVGPDHPYRKRLEQELLDPTTCVTAAVKLEALGIESRKALRVGLESDSPWVRFAAAEALAYLGQTDGTPELANLAARHPGVRYHCLKALAALDDAASTLKLTDLMATGTRPCGTVRSPPFASPTRSATRSVANGRPPAGSTSTGSPPGPGDWST